MHWKSTGAVFDYMDAHPLDIEMHELLCLIRLAETPALPAEDRAQLIEKLAPIIERTVAKTPAEWANYVLTPLDIALSPASPFAD